MRPEEMCNRVFVPTPNCSLIYCNGLLLSSLLLFIMGYADCFVLSYCFGGLEGRNEVGSRNKVEGRNKLKGGFSVFLTSYEILTTSA